MIELITAFSILALILIALLPAFPFGLSVNREAESNSISSYLAQQKIEEISAIAYSDISTGVIEPKNSLPSPAGFERQTEVSYVDENLNDSLVDLGLKKISTTIYYFSPVSHNEKIFNLFTLISKK